MIISSHHKCLVKELTDQQKEKNKIVEPTLLTPNQIQTDLTVTHPQAFRLPKFAALPSFNCLKELYIFTFYFLNWPGSEGKMRSDLPEHDTIRPRKLHT